MDVVYGISPHSPQRKGYARWWSLTARSPMGIRYDGGGNWDISLHLPHNSLISPNSILTIHLLAQ